MELKPQWVKIVAPIVAASEPERYGNCGKTKFHGQIALLQSVDRGFETIIAKLNEYDLTKKTVVIFTSDNGIVLERVNHRQRDRGIFTPRI